MVRGSKAKRLRKEALAAHPDGSTLSLQKIGEYKYKGAVVGDKIRLHYEGLRRHYQDSKRTNNA